MTLKKIIMLAEDNSVFRKDLSSFLEDEGDMQVVGETGDCQTALDLIRELSPNIVVMDVTMPGLNGIEATKQIAAQSPDTLIVALSNHSEKQLGREILQAGASAFLLKESPTEELAQEIRAVMRNERLLSPVVASAVVSDCASTISSGEPNDGVGDTILRTKFHRPPLPMDYVHRPRLVEALKRGRDMPLTLVTAPAGYGKSTLVSSWLGTCGCRSAWLALDENDNHLRTFLLYFVSAVQTLFPDALGKMLAVLNAITLPPTHDLAATLINDLDDIEDWFVLVMDDFHYIRDSSILDLLDELLLHPPRNAHFVMIGRKDPFLSITSCRAHGQVSELRVQGLRFLTEETALFLQHVLKQEVGQTTAEEWTERTEGWIGGLRLAVLSMQRGEDAENILAQIPKDADYVGEYLFNELLSRQTPAMRDFLLKISIMDRFCAPLCDAICQPAGDSEDAQVSSSELISQMNKDNLFIINLDQEGYWFRFHHMFGKMLNVQLQRLFSYREIAQLHSRASSWFAENDLTDEAIMHAMSAGNTDAAVRLVEANRHAILNKDKWFVLERWMSMFPEELVHKRPELLMALIWIRNYHFDFASIQMYLAKMTQLPNNEIENQTIRGEVELFHGILYFLKNDSARSLLHLENALKILPESYLEAHGQIEVYYCLANQMQGNIQGAITRLNDLLHKLKKDSSILKTRAQVTLAYVHIIAGCLPDVLMANRLLREYSLKNNYMFAEVWSLYLPGLVHFYQNNLDQAIMCFQEVEKKRHSMNTRAAVDAMTGLALAYQAKGQHEQAYTTIEELLDYIAPFSDPTYLMIARSCQVRLAILNNQLNSATSWLHQASPPAENMLFWLEIPSVTYCKALLAEGSAISIEASASKLEELLKLNQNNHNVCWTIQIMPLLALAYEKLGRHDEALDMLKKAVELANSGGWVRPFVELGTPMADLLKQLLKKTVHLDQIDVILNAIRYEQSNVPQASGQDGYTPSSHDHTQATSLIDPLTFREQETLKLMLERKYNKEIAETLGISLETVKTHIKHIFQKLDISNRREAVTRANELGLIIDHIKNKS
jgi:LuxR family maltose regulon positive regulatory protein